jgi:alanine dehydrogenase
MPPLSERLRLAERTMTALVADAELPPKIGVHPRPADAFGHAMPAFLRGAAADGSEDGLGMKWVTGVPGNAAAGLAAIHGLLLLNDPMTGVPVGILDAGPITAERTAAVSGVAIARFGPVGPGAGPVRVALIGSGVQGRSHLPVIAHLLPGCTLAVAGRDPGRVAAFADEARATPGIGRVECVATPREAVTGATVVITAASFGPVTQVMTNDWLAPDALVVAVDYATYAAAEVAREAVHFVVDERGQFLANRAAGRFEGYPDPGLTLGEAILRGVGHPERGRVLVTHLGVGLADLVFGREILARATAAGSGVELPR